LTVVKKDGRREEFNPDKLRSKLRIALTKRPVGEEELDELVGRIEGQLLALGTKEVSSDAVGELALRCLKDVDHVAYIRFASVYREFADVDDIRHELEGLSPAITLPSTKESS
jgi:transcriptional repressor NrdR